MKTQYFIPRAVQGNRLLAVLISLTMIGPFGGCDSNSGNDHENGVPNTNNLTEITFVGTVTTHPDRAAIQGATVKHSAPPSSSTITSVTDSGGNYRINIHFDCVAYPNHWGGRLDVTRTGYFASSVSFLAGVWDCIEGDQHIDITLVPEN